MKVDQIVFVSYWLLLEQVLLVGAVPLNGVQKYNCWSLFRDCEMYWSFTARWLDDVCHYVVNISYVQKVRAGEDQPTSPRACTKSKYRYPIRDGFFMPV